MAIKEKRIYSGPMLEVVRYRCTENGRRIGRGPRENASSESQARRNLKAAQQQLMRLMNCNFSRGDYHITLTFRKDLDREERRSALRRFIRRMRKRCRQRDPDADLAYIYVEEDAGVRPHFHIVCRKFAQGLTLEELSEAWGLGRVGIETLDGNPDYGWFARYLTKQKDGEKGRRRFVPSKNLRQPVEPPPKVLKRKYLAARPKVPKDYYVLASYRQVTAAGYEWEYVIAIRYDRMDALPDEVVESIMESDTWKDMTDGGI